jgi:hypothetical protein
MLHSSSTASKQLIYLINPHSYHDKPWKNSAKIPRNIIPVFTPQLCINLESQNPYLFLGCMTHFWMASNISQGNEAILVLPFLWANPGQRTIILRLQAPAARKCTHSTILVHSLKKRTWHKICIPISSTLLHKMSCSGKYLISYMKFMLKMCAEIHLVSI